MALGFQLVLRPVLLTTAREGLRHAPFSQNFSPNTGTGCEAWIQTSSELAELSIAKPCTGEMPLQLWTYLWTSCRAQAGDRTDRQSGFSKSPNDCQNCVLAILWLSTPDRRQRGANIATGHFRQQDSAWASHPCGTFQLPSRAALHLPRLEQGQPGSVLWHGHVDTEQQTISWRHWSCRLF